MHRPHRLTELDSGVRVVTESMPAVRSVALGFWIGTGSGAETEPEAGLSHLIEHMLFRGTDRYASLEIDQIFDAMGAELNAGTGKESTSVYSRVIDRHLADAFDVMADMVWRPRFDPAELESEREIVLEEIAMYEDDPQDKVFDVLGGAVFGDHPLGRAIIGRSDVVASAPAETLATFHAERYIPRNVVVAAAGSVEHEEVVALATRMASEQPRPYSILPPARRAPPVPQQPIVRFIAKDTEQYHVCLGGQGIACDDERRFALRVLDNVLGATSSSRLFQEVRERRGLAYAVYSFVSTWTGTGQVGLYLGTRPDNVSKALTVVGAELWRLCQEPPTADEIDRAKENIKGRLVLSLESTTARMNRLGSFILSGIPILSMDEVLERIDAVTVDDVAQLTRDLFAPSRLSAAAIGAEEAVFRRSLEAISPSLAVAA